MEQEYVVQEGDNLSTILYNFTGDGSYENAVKIAEQNGISNPSHIEPGQTIKFTVENSTTSSSGTTASQSNNSNTMSPGTRGNSKPTGVSEVAFSDATEFSQQTTSRSDYQSTAASTNNIPNPKTNAASGSITGLNVATGNQEIRAVQMDPETSSASTTNQASPSVATSNTNSDTRNTTFSYGIDEDDSIEYNVEEARKILIGAIDPDIQNICKTIENMISTLADLQKIAHDKENTNVAQDYKDFETIIGNDVEGLNGFVSDAFDVCVSVYETINEWERITQK